MTDVSSQKLFILSEVALPTSFNVLERESGNKQTLIICLSLLFVMNFHLRLTK